MKLTILSNDFPSKGRPVYVFVEQLVNTLVDQGIEISVIAPQSLTRSILRNIPLLPKRMTVETKKGNKYNVYRPYSLTLSNKNISIFSWYNVFAIENTLKKIKPEILYGHFWDSAYKLKNYALKHNLPLFVACGEGDNALEDMVATISSKDKEELVRAVKGVISVSSENKNKCIKFDLCKEDDVVVLPNCVDDSLFYNHDREEYRKLYSLSDDDFLITFCGHFIARKGSNRLSKAIEKLNDPHIKVAFVGKSMSGDDCTPNCPGIIWMNTMSHDELPKLLNASDVFVLPTLKEGCSNAIVEALACGIPVISSNRPFNADILNSCNSIMVDPENVDEIAEAIRKMKDDQAFYNETREYTVKHSIYFSIKERAKSIVRFIEEKTKRS